jgi:UDP-N-acetylmuramate dehydrogenase
VSAFLTEHGLAGMEFASGIPGSMGGAVFMNAGAYGGEMKDIIESVRLMKPDGSEVLELGSEEMDFGYRHSMVEDSGLIVLSALLKLTPDDPEAISARVRELQERRNAKQPVNYPSAGSTFKRPVGGYAAAMIDQAGLRGYRSGGAMVSEKHAGFVINTGGATAEDVLSVMRHVREVVFEKNGVMLEPEVRLINCEL